MEKETQQLNLVVNADTKKADEKLEKTAKKAEQLGKRAQASLLNTQKAAKQILNSNSFLQGLTGTPLLSSFQGLSKSFKDSFKVDPQNLEGVNAAIDEIKLNMAAFGLESVLSAEELALIKDAATQIEPPIKLSTIAVKAFNGAVGIAKKSFDKLKATAIAPFEKIGRGFEKLKNIIVYRLLRQGLSKLIQGFDQGKKSIEEYDKLLNGTSWSKASSLMQGMNANATVLRGTFASLYMTVLAQIKPAIDAMVDSIVNAVNAVNMLISALSGRSGFTKALKYPQDYAEAANGAAKATRLWLGAFDEINRLDDNSGGGSSEAMDYSKLFEEVSISDAFKEMLGRNDFEGVGQAIADKLNKSIEGADFYGMGTRIGIKIRHAIDTALGFMQNFDFKNLGHQLSEWVEGGIGAINWENAGSLLVTGFTSVIDFLGGLLGNPETWSALGGAISDFIKGAITSATSWLKDKDWAAATENLFDCIKGFVLNIDFGGIFGAMWEFASTLVQVGIGVLFVALGKVFYGLGEAFSNAGFGFPGDLFKGLGLGLGYWGEKILGRGEDTAAKYEEGLDNGLFRAFKTVSDWIDKIDGLLSGFEDWKIDFNATLKNNGWTTPGYKSIANNIQKSTTATDLKRLQREQQDTTLGNWLKSVDWSQPLINQFRANGGTVPTGDLFIANEQGPELVGSVGGRTTVTNQDQFVAGMEAANEPVVQAILSAANAIIGTVNSKNYTVELDGAKVSKQIYSAMNSEGMRRGTSLAWGQ